jgi:hypothetical protein
MAAARKLVGKTQPRLWTPPLRKLTRATSHGYAIADFADTIGEPFLPWQRWLAIHAMETNPDGSYRFRVIVVLVSRQNGKALDLGTEVLTSRGFVTMADIREGDEVHHPGGHLTRVVGVSEVMHDHECYRVTTTDGRSIIADRDHLWTVTDKRRGRSVGPRGSTVKWFETATMTTGEMAAAGISRCATGTRTSVTGGKRYATNEYRFHLPSQGPLQSRDVALPIAPYTLGAWLGDGNSSSASFTCADEGILNAIRDDGYLIKARSARIHYLISNEPERQRRIEEGRKLIPAMGVIGAAAHVGVGRDCMAGSGVRPGPRIMAGAPAEMPALGSYKTLHELLRDLGVLGSKHVPDIYLTAGGSQREALLQGLLDTDGSIDRVRGQVEFCSILRPLADAVLFLARSLGWRATLRTGRATLNGRDCGPKYRVFFTPKTTDPFCPFRLPRKVARIRDVDGNKGRATLSIASIEPVESRPVRCIQVESPDGLFLAGRDLIPTHNSSIKRTVSLWRLYVDGARLILGVAQDVGLAREQQNYCVDTIYGCPDLAAELDHVRRVNGDEWFRVAAPEIEYEDVDGDESMTLSGGGRYKIAASNRKAGRGLSIDELNVDEGREWHTFEPWSALFPTTMARPRAQIWMMSNAGDDRSVVLNMLRDSALSGRDETIGLFEWSAPDGCELDDVNGWRQANPALGHLIDEGFLRTAMHSQRPNDFRTENLCQKVDQLDGAIDYEAWKACADTAGLMDALRDRIAVCLDVAPDGGHATLAAAGRTADGRPRIEVVAEWTTMASVRADLPALLEKIRPRAFGWFPGGPAAEMATTLQPLALRYNRHPGKRQDGEFPEDGQIGGAAVSQVCMELAGLVRDRSIIHAGQDLLDTHIRGASKLATGDGWRLTRRGEGYCDAAYAAAGAVNAALRMPERKRSQMRLIAA